MRGLFIGLTVLASVVVVGGCTPYRADVIAVPETNGRVLDSETGVGVARAEVAVVGHASLSGFSTDPVFTDEQGAFVLPLQRHRYWTVRLMTVGGVYVSTIHIRARHPDYADSQVSGAYVFPFQDRMDHVAIIAFRTLETVPPAFNGCAVSDDEQYAYTLAHSLSELVEQDWFRSRAAYSPRSIDRLKESLDGTLIPLSRRCEISHEDYLELRRTYTVPLDTLRNQDE